jgi:hypothetical protein
MIKNYNVKLLEVLFTVHYGTLMNQNQLDTLSLVCLLRFNAFTCFGRYLLISTGSAQLLFGVNTCVGCVLTAQSTHTLRTQLHQTATVQNFLKMSE